MSIFFLLYCLCYSSKTEQLKEIFQLASSLPTIGQALARNLRVSHTGGRYPNTRAICCLQNAFFKQEACTTGHAGNPRGGSSHCYHKAHPACTSFKLHSPQTSWSPLVKYFSSTFFQMKTGAKSVNFCKPEKINKNFPSCPQSI